MYTRLPLLTASLCLAALTLAAPALAADGLLEMNQACVPVGCFTGDAPGFPVTISESGSYRLTSNLQVPEGNTGIDVTVDNVSLDLGGFVIRGATECVRDDFAVSCSPGGDGHGIRGRNGVRVHNGTVRGMGEFGVVLGDSATVQDLVVEHNNADGLFVASGTLERVKALRNHRDGFALTAGTVESCQALFNGGRGFILRDVAISGSVAAHNGLDGLVCDPCIALGNVLRDNARFGLEGANDTGYAYNILDGNNGGANEQVGSPVTALPLELGPNVCRRNTVCP